MEQLDKYTLYVKKAILSGKIEKFSDEGHLHCICSTFFDREKYPALLNLIKAGLIEYLPKVGHTENKFREYLYVYEFVDQLWLFTTLSNHDSNL